MRVGADKFREYQRSRDDGGLSGGDEMIDRLTFRKLENGFTVRYHIQDDTEHGRGGERFFATKGEVGAFVFDLLEVNLGEMK